MATSRIGAVWRAVSSTVAEQPMAISVASQWVARYARREGNPITRLCSTWKVKDLLIAGRMKEVPMTQKKQAAGAIKPPTKDQQQRAASGKIQRALEIRKSSSASRAGKPLAFPTHSVCP